MAPGYFAHHNRHTHDCHHAPAWGYAGGSRRTSNKVWATGIVTCLSHRAVRGRDHRRIDLHFDGMAGRSWDGIRPSDGRHRERCRAHRRHRPCARPSCCGHCYDPGNARGPCRSFSVFWKLPGLWLVIVSIRAAVQICGWRDLLILRPRTSMPWRCLIASAASAAV